MGQKMTRRLSEDTLSLFPPLSNSANSLSNDCTLDDLVNNNYKDKKSFKTSKKISKLKKSLSECFRSKFNRLEEITDNDEEIMNVHRSKSDHVDVLETVGRSYQSKESSRSILISDAWTSQDLPRDLHEVHSQLTTLMSLLSQTDLNTREVSCQTADVDITLKEFAFQRDSLIFDQHEKINNLYRELEAQSHTIEGYIREITVLKTQQSRQRLENKNHNHLINFVKEIKEGKILQKNDFTKIDEVIEYLTCPSQSIKSQIEKANVAVINPCSNIKEESCTLYSSHTEYQTSYNPFNNYLKDQQETKLICFLDHSVTPYTSTMPLELCPITLSHVKDHTKSILPKDINCRYIFKSIIPGSAFTQEEITQDTDLVPVQDDKIIVRIRM